MTDTRMETYYGFVSTSEDALALFEACRLGYKQRVPRRLSDSERAAIRSGSVFIWEENESGMKRWTDGRSWSPSRVQGSFLTYHEWEGRRRAQRHPSGGLPGFSQYMGIARYGHFIGGPTKAGSTQVQYGFPKENGMLKRALSIRTTDGCKLHLIAYYSKEDHMRRTLPTPTTDPRFPKLVVPGNLYPDMSPESMYGTNSEGKVNSRRNNLGVVDEISAAFNKARVRSLVIRPEEEEDIDSDAMRPHVPALPQPMSAPSSMSGLDDNNRRTASNSFSSETQAMVPRRSADSTSSAPSSTILRSVGSNSKGLGLLGSEEASRPRRMTPHRSVTTTGIVGYRPLLLSPIGADVMTAPVKPPPMSVASIRRDHREGPRRLPSISDEFRRDGLGIFTTSGAYQNCISAMPHPYARSPAAVLRKSRTGGMRSVSLRQSEDIRQLFVLDQQGI